MYDLPAETFIGLMVEPKLIGASYKVIDERLMTSPTTWCEIRQDLYGNPQRCMLATPGIFSFEFTAEVESAPNGLLPQSAIAHPPREIPPEAMIYTLPSRYCQSDQLSRMAQGEFGRLTNGAERVIAVTNWVREHVEYRYGTTDSLTSAFDTATERVGVCRDFAHLVIAFCRALDIPARYASGYALGLEPPDFHGFVQVYLSGAWHNVDATSEAPRPALVPIAVGRDAADVPLTTLWGMNTFLEQSVEVQRIES
jgi:transglutaminase-like putative cysteine protease